MDKMPIVTLANGLRLGNFSSPNQFIFVEGDEILEACSEERVDILNPGILEIHNNQTINGISIKSVEIDSHSTAELLDEIHDQLRNLEVDIILLSVSVMEIIRKLMQGDASKVQKTPFRLPKVRRNSDSILWINSNIFYL
jgi:hypothetical protein